MQDGGGVLARLRRSVPANAQPAATALLAANLEALPGLLEALAAELKVPEAEDDNFWDVDAPRLGSRPGQSGHGGPPAPPPRPSTLDPWSALFCLAALAPLPVLQLVEQELKNLNVDLLGLTDQDGNSALNVAILGNKFESVKHLCEGLPGLCLRHNWNKELPLQLAVRAASPEILQEILKGAHAKAGTRIDEQGNTVLICAIAYQKINLVQSLLDNHNNDSNNPTSTSTSTSTSASASASDSSSSLHLPGLTAFSKCNHDGESPLMVAARVGSLPLVELLLAHSAEVGVQDDGANTVLHHAVKSKSLEVVRCLASQPRVCINEANEDDETALHLAPLVSRSADILVCLLEAKADPSLPDSEGFTVLHKSIRANNLECVKELYKRGDSLESRCGEGLTALLTAAKCSTYEMVQYLLESKADCSVIDSHSQNAVHLALVNSTRLAMELLRSNLFALEQPDEDGMTPFLVAARYSELTAVEYMVETALVDTEARDREGDTALALAVVGHRLDLLPYLLSIISCQVRNLAGQTPAIQAARYSPPEVLQCLIEAEADISVRDAQGCDCVMSAVLGGNLPCLQILVASQCSLTALNNEGENALLMSLRTNDEQIVDYLMHIPQRHVTMLHVLPRNVTDAVLIRNRSIKKCPPGKQGDRRRKEIFETREELLEKWNLPDVVVAKVCCWNARKLERRARQERIRLKPHDDIEDENS